MHTQYALRFARILSCIASASLFGVACGSDSSFIDPRVGPSKDTVVPAGGSFQVVHEDEFEGPAGTPPDPTMWTPEVGTDWGNQQLEYDTDRPENASLDGAGHLVLTARKESYMGRDYTSARLNTRDNFDPLYGKFEIRMKLPKGQGLWPAFWMLGSDISEVGWPECGEIDILEYRGQNVSEIRSSLHGPGYSAGENLGQDYEVDADLSEDFHTYAAEWTPLGVAFYFDGERFLSYHKERFSVLKWAFDNPHFVILNLAVGGSYVGDVGSDTVFPAQLVVDWVRFYEYVDP